LVMYVLFLFGFYLSFTSYFFCIINHTIVTLFCIGKFLIVMRNHIHEKYSGPRIALVFLVCYFISRAMYFTKQCISSIEIAKIPRERFLEIQHFMEESKHFIKWRDEFNKCTTNGILLPAKFAELMTNLNEESHYLPKELFKPILKSKRDLSGEKESEHDENKDAKFLSKEPKKQYEKVHEKLFITWMIHRKRYKNMTCKQCGQEDGASLVHCVECCSYFCSGCNLVIHKHVINSMHKPKMIVLKIRDIDWVEKVFEPPKAKVKNRSGEALIYPSPLDTIAI